MIVFLICVVQPRFLDYWFLDSRDQWALPHPVRGDRWQILLNRFKQVESRVSFSQRTLEETCFFNVFSLGIQALRFRVWRGLLSYDKLDLVSRHQSDWVRIMSLITTVGPRKRTSFRDMDVVNESSIQVPAVKPSASSLPHPKLRRLRKCDTFVWQKQRPIGTSSSSVNPTRPLNKLRSLSSL